MTLAAGIGAGDVSATASAGAGVQVQRELGRGGRPCTDAACPQTTVSGAHSATATTLNVASTAPDGIPFAVGDLLAIRHGASITVEYAKVTAIIDGTSMTVQRCAATLNIFCRERALANGDVVLLVNIFVRLTCTTEVIDIRSVTGDTVGLLRGMQGTTPATAAGGCGLEYGVFDVFDDASINQNASLNPNGGGSPDSDNDGCSNREELVNAQAAGGNRDPLWPYDFTDPPGPATGGVLTAASTRSKSIVLADVSVILAYVGRTNTHAAYIADNNLDGIPDGLQLDRTPAANGHLANPGNGAITLQDASVTLAQVGTSCVPAP